MSKWSAYLLIILLLCSLTGCKTDVVGAFEDAGELQLVLPGDSVQTIAQESKLYAWLSSWIESHQDGWSSSPASYQPGYIIKGDRFYLNINKDFAVLNYIDGNGDNHQYVRHLDAGDFDSFKKMAGA